MADQQDQQQTHTIGARITEEGVEFFGTDELNALLSQGRRVANIEPGEVLVEEVSEEEAGEEEGGYVLSGFEFIVTLQG